MTLAKTPIKKRKVSTKPKEEKIITAREKKLKTLKEVVTWALVVFFGISCVGFIIGGSFGQKGGAPGGKEPGKAGVQSEIEFWQAKVNEDPNDANAYANLALQFQQAGQLEKAEDNYKKAIELDPKYTFPYAHLAKLYFSKKDFKQAISLQQKAVSLSPDNQEYRFELMSYFVAAKNLDSAMAEAREIIARDPEMPNNYAVASEILFIGKYKKEALEIIDSALQKFKGDKEAVSYFQNMKNEIEKREKK